MRKECALCKEKIGFLALSIKLKHGERVCESCMKKLNISQAEINAFYVYADAKRLSLELFSQAINGNEEKKKHLMALVKRASKKENSVGKIRRPTVMHADTLEKLYHTSGLHSFLAALVFYGYIGQIGG